MRKIDYDSESVKASRDKIDTCNNEIIESLNNIYKTVEDIDTVLNTPKSQEIIPRYNSYINDRINYLNEKKYDYKTLFYYIIEKYDDYFDSVKKMTGDRND